jgi:hypothetical protein
MAQVRELRVGEEASWHDRFPSGPPDLRGPYRGSDAAWQAVLVHINAAGARVPEPVVNPPNTKRPFAG